MSQILNPAAIKALIPNRSPYLLLDRVQIGESGQTAEAVKNVTLNEPYFTGHFPVHPIMPGVLQIDAMCQLAALVIKHNHADQSGIPFVYGLDKIKFRRPVTPGDRLTVQVELGETADGKTQVTANTSVEGQVSCQAEIQIGTITEDQLQPQQMAPARRCEVDAPCLDIEGIMNAIPHRFPFLLVDRILSSEGESSIALKNISANDHFLAGLDVDQPFVPSHFIPEIAAQAGCAYILSMPEHQGKIGYFMSIDKSVFHRPVLPGDQLLVETDVTIARGRIAKGNAKVYVGEELVAETEIKVTIVGQE